MITQTKKRIKAIAYILLFDMGLSILFPSTHAIYALTSGPSAPEFSSFEPVATTNMVTPFTGSFTYNLPVIQVPGPDGAGYAMSLSYHSGTSSEEDASWVGHGWTLNPGAINRSVRGFPDEYNGEVVKVYSKNRPNWTMSGTEKINLEGFSVGLGFSDNIRFNNYQGLAKTQSFGVSVPGLNLSMNRSATGITFSAGINVFHAFKAIQKLNKKDRKKAKEAEKPKQEETTVEFQFDGNSNKNGGFESKLKSAAINKVFGFQTYTDAGQQTTLSKLEGFNLNLSFGSQINPTPVPVGSEIGLLGAFSLNYEMPSRKVFAKGYLHHNSLLANERSDYLVEKGQAYDRKDYFIGVPFTTPDTYMLTGEGLSGSFRPYRQSVGNLLPEGVSSNIKTFGIGFETMIGANVGLGLNLAFGGSKSSMKEWISNGNSDNFSLEKKAVQYRFSGDMGGKIEYGNNELTTAKLSVFPNFPGLMAVTPNVDAEKISDYDTKVAGQSSYINHEKNKKFTIYSESGTRYSYTLPVKTKNNASISIDVSPNDNIENNNIVYKNLYMGADYNVNENEHDIVLGENREETYDNIYLLESITTPDYVDLGGIGPDEEDFGGWTKFEYHEVCGGNNWFRWRTPYTGLLYNKGSISEVKDDTGFVSTGEKEVKYLKKVETKTHVAYFVTNKTTVGRFPKSVSSQAKYLTGTQSIRNDGFEAPRFDNGKDLAANNPNAKALERLEYLEKVVLFAKDRPEVPLQITNFQYDYSLVPNVPNNKNSKVNGNPSNYKESGKLTLRKVWSEFEGTYNARISSYKFEYRYKDKADYPSYLYSEHPSLAKFFNLSDRYSLNAQNPAYGPHLLDAWGNNQYNGPNRHLKLRKWPYQGIIPKDANYDPAAWQLKQIKLPSGGEILVEYESNQYQYVQDRPAMTLVKLKSYQGGENPVITLDLSDIGIDGSDPEASEYLIKGLNDYFFKNKKSDTKNSNTKFTSKRVYFKFLYDLLGNNPSLDNCKSEYITGYSKVKSFALSGNSLKVFLNGKLDKIRENNLIKFLPFLEDDNYQLTPKQACFDFYVTQRWNKYTAGCESEEDVKYGDEIADLAFKKYKDSKVSSMVKKTKLLVSALKGMTNKIETEKYPKKEKICLNVNEELSYLKIPIFKPKRGGGVRVKRLLMYDKGIETGDAAIYGQEYKYELEDGTSSGVATNEPSAMREDNALVGFLPKENQSWLDRLITGKDKEQSEGPIGETLLPGPSVGYSRVITENIHKGQTGTGYVINEYYTCKDYPFDKSYDYRLANKKGNTSYDIGGEKAAYGVEYSILQDNAYDDRLSIPAPYFQYRLEKSWMSQGFRFIINDMHGKPKSTRTYGGDYASGDKSFISSGQDFYYFEPGEKMVMLNKTGNWKYDIPGKEMDVAMEKYRINTQNLDFGFEIDVSVGLSVAPPIIVSGSLNFSISEQMLNKYAISKVIRYPVVQKKIITYSDNIASTTENLAFDSETGDPILTKSYDAYHNIPLYDSDKLHDGSIYSLNIPAHWHYLALGKKSVNKAYSNQLKSSAGQIISYGKNANPVNKDKTWNIKQNRVISASANTYAAWSAINNNKTNVLETIYGSIPDDELNKVLRPHKSYVYKEGTKASSSRNTDNSKIYEGGILKSFTPFDYNSNSQDEKWVKTNQVTMYSPNGNVLEEQNVLDIYSSAKFGYRFTQPVMVSQNAQYGDTFFEHYEDKYDNKTSLTNGFAHSGTYSKVFTSGSPLFGETTLSPSNDLLQQGGWLNFWAASATKDPLHNIQIEVSGQIYRPEKVAITGDWSLFRLFIKPEVLGTAINPVIILDNTSEINIDDIKFQPKEAQSTCYVYDAKSLRLITVFDDQHFGLYYVYNNEGQLVRKLMETERGMKILSETQYNVPRENR